MIGESKVRLGLHDGHVTANAGLTGDCHGLMGGLGMAAGANGIVSTASQRLMGLMATDARHRAFRFLETLALVQIDGLMPNVPCFAPIGILAGLAMAVAAIVIHCRTVQLAWVEDRRLRAAALNVPGSRPMARFATHSQFRGFNREVSRKL